MEKIQLKILDPIDIANYWATVGPWILTAVGEGVDDTDVNYIRSQALAGAAQIWIVSRKDIEAVLVTEAAFYGGRRTLVLRWLCGTLVEAWEDILTALEEWAYHNHFEYIEAWGRKGWDKVLRPMGYSHQFTIVGKTLIRRFH
jgi:hypothetical protein